MSFDQWEKKTLESPGAEERVQDIEDELRTAGGLEWHKARKWDSELWGWDGEYLIGQAIYYPASTSEAHWRGFIRHFPITGPMDSPEEACRAVDAQWTAARKG